MARRLRRSEPTELQVGADATLNIPLWDSAGAKLTVTGLTASFQLYKAVPGRGRKPFKGNVVLTKTSAAGTVALTEGNAAVTIADTDLANRAGAFWFILLLTTTATGAIAHGAEGIVNIRAAPA